LNVKLNDDQKSISVEQTLIYHNPHQKSINQIKLLNWVSAYQNRKTPLLKRKVEDRKKDLYFAKDDKLGKLENFQYSYGNIPQKSLIKLRKTFIPLGQPLESGRVLDLI
jgi:hypothetical protein